MTSKASPAKPLSIRKRDAILKVVSNKDKMNELRVLVEKFIFWDCSHPETRVNHEIIWSEFQHFDTSVFNATDPADIWTLNTILDRSKEDLFWEQQMSMEKGDELEAALRYVARNLFVWGESRVYHCRWMIQKDHVFWNWHVESEGPDSSLERRYFLPYTRGMRFST